MVIKKVELEKSHEVFAEPTPLGLIGLAIGCAALTPIGFGYGLNPAGFKTAAMFCLLFGGGCQMLSGLMNFANKNLFGGTVLTAFSFNWIMNWWVLSGFAEGKAPDHTILLATDSCSLLLFLVITYGFGFFSKLLFFFLLDIDFLYAAKLVKALTGTHAVDMPIAILTVLLGLIALWIAFASLINPTSGRVIFPIPGPMFAVKKAAAFDWTLRNTIFEVLFQHWSAHAFDPLPTSDVENRVSTKLGPKNLAPDLAYLIELGAIVGTTREGHLVDVRLSARGIDLYEQLMLHKYEF